MNSVRLQCEVLILLLHIYSSLIHSFPTKVGVQIALLALHPSDPNIPHGQTRGIITQEKDSDIHRML